MRNKEFILESNFSNEKKAITLLITTAYSILNDFNKPLKKYNLSLTQINILHVVNEFNDEALTVGEIKKRMIEANPNVSRALRKLENKGLIVKQRDNVDQRVVFINITEDGKKLLEVCENESEKKEFRLNESETELLINLLVKI